MAKKGNKGPRILIRLNSSAGTGHFYTTSTNTRNNGAKNKSKLELRKFDPVVRQYVMYKEGKIK